MSKTNKTLVANMQHVKTNLIPPRSGPNPQGLNINYNTVTKHSKKIVNEKPDLEQIELNGLVC